MTDNTQTRSRSAAIVSGRDSSSSRQSYSSPIPPLPSSSSSYGSSLHNTNVGHYPRSLSNDLQRPSSNNSSNNTPGPYSPSSQLQQSRQPLVTLRPGPGTSATTRMRSGSNPPPPLYRDPTLSASDSLFPQRRAFRESTSTSSSTGSSTANGTQAPVGTYSRSVLAETGDKDRASPGPSTGTFRNMEGKFSPGFATGTGTRARAVTSSGSSGMERRNMFTGAISGVAERPPYSAPAAREPSSGGAPSYGSSLHVGAKSPSPAPRSKSISIPPVYSSHVTSTSPAPTTTSSASNAVLPPPPPAPRYSTKPTPASSAQLTPTSAASSGIGAAVTVTKETSTAQCSSPLPAASAVDLAGKRLREQQLQDRFKAAQSFIERTVAQSLPSSDLHESLKDGVILCRLANRLRPGTVEQISLKNLPFVKMENISNFLNAAKQLGVQSSDLFQTVDLYEGKDMNQVVSTILTLERVVGGVARMVPKDKRPGPSPSLTTGSTSQIPKAGINGAPVVTRVRSKTAHAPSKVSATPSIRPSSSSYYAAQVRKLEEDSIRFAAGYDRLETTTFKSKDPRHQSTPVISRSTPTPTRDKPPRLPSVNYIDAGVDNINFGGDDFDSSHLEALNRREQRDLVFGSGSSLTLEQSASISKSASGPHLSVDGKASALDMSRRRMKSISLDPQAANAVMGSPNYRNALASPGSPGVLTQSASYNAISNLNSPGAIGANTQLVNLKQHSRFPSDKTVDGNNRSVLGSPTSSRSTTPVQGIRKSLNGIEPLREKLELWENDVPVATYQLGNCIGRGQFGAVYRALNLGSGQMVAVKRIKIDGLKDDERDMLMQEVDLLKALAHPSIVKYEGFIKTEGYLNIILEFVENGSLLTTLKSFGTFPEKLVVAYVVKILEGLVYLHGKEVVHCDLKAANILTTKNGNVKLSDFGVSLNLKVKESDFGAVAGTPNWMAPEVIELKGASPASDIWSLGCTIVEMLTGRPPYADLLAMTTLFRIVEDERPPLPNNLSADLLDFLCQCFQKDPILRPSAGDLGRHVWIKRNFASRELKPMDSLPYMKRKLLEPKEKTPMATTVKESTINAAKRASTPLGLSSVPPPAASATAIFPTSGRSTRRGSVDSASGPYASSTVPAPTHFAEKYQEMKSGKLDNQHQFVKSSFAKPVECRLCHDYVKKQAVICQDCSMVFHRACQFYVGNTCFPGPHLSYFQTPTPAQSVPNLKILANGKPKGASRPNSRTSQPNLDDRSRSVTPSQGISLRPCPTPPLSAYAKRETTTANENRERQRRATVSPPPVPSGSHRTMPSDDYSHHMEQHSQNHGSRPSSRQSDNPTSPTLSGLRNFIAGPRRFSFSSKKNGAQSQTASHPLPTPPASYTAPSTPTYGMNVRQQSGTPDSSKGFHAGHGNFQQMQRQAPITPPKTLPVPIMMNNKTGSGGRAYRGREYLPGGPLDPFAGDHESISNRYGLSHQRQSSSSIFSTSAPPVHADFVGRRDSRDGRRSAASTKYGSVEDEDADYHGRAHGEMANEEDDDDDAGHEDIDDMEEEDLEALLVPSIARRTPRSSVDAGNPVTVTNGIGGGHHKVKSQSFGQVLSQQQQQPQNHYERDAVPRSPTAISFGAPPIQPASSLPSSRLQQEQQNQQQQQQQQQYVSQAGRTGPLSNGYNSSGSSSAALTSSYSSQSNNSSSASSLGSTVAALLEEEDRMLKEMRLNQRQQNSSSAGKNGMLNIPSAYNQATSPPQSHHVDIRTMFSRMSASPNKGFNSNSNINGYKEKDNNVFSHMNAQDKKELPTKLASNPARHQIQTQQQHSHHPLNGVRSIHPLLSDERASNPKTEFSQGYERISHYQHEREYGTRTGSTNGGTTSDGNTAAWRVSSPGGISYSGYSGVPSASATLGSGSNNAMTTAGTTATTTTTTTTGIAAASALKRGGKVMRRSMGAALEKERWD